MSYNVKGRPWTYRGAIDVSQCQTSEEVMIKSGLDWTTAKCELVGKMPINMGSDFDADLDKLNAIKERGGFIYGKDVVMILSKGLII